MTIQITVQIPAINIGLSKAIWCHYNQYKVFSEAMKTHKKITFKSETHCQRMLQIVRDFRKSPSCNMQNCLSCCVTFLVTVKEADELSKVQPSREQ